MNEYNEPMNIEPCTFEMDTSIECIILNGAEL